MSLPSNRTVIPYASQARTATPTPPEFKAKEARGLLVFINVTAVVSSPSVVFTIEGKDPVSGTWYTILASAAVVGTGFTVLRVFPGSTVTANLAANDTLPENWRLKSVHGNSNSITYSVAAQLIQ